LGHHKNYGGPGAAPAPRYFTLSQLRGNGIFLELYR
jgi:hypothetical protein